MQADVPFFSICIPAYKRHQNIVQLLHSIEEQTCTDYEIVITDDSPDDAVNTVCQKYTHLPIRYYKNNVPLGTPANWNFAIAQAKGKWIKLMHDDDLFAVPTALATFKRTAQKYDNRHFLFCAYANVNEITKQRKAVYVNKIQWWFVQKNWAALLANNLVGPPSVTLHRNNPQFTYDERVKWVVDMDFYIRYFKLYQPTYINEVLIDVGINDTQVTNYTFGRPDVQLKENLYLLHKIGFNQLRNMIVFDAWWRMLRNFKIKSGRQLQETGYKGPISGVIEKMIQFQNRKKLKLPMVGIVSKVQMLVCYLLLYRSIPK